MARAQTIVGLILALGSIGCNELIAAKAPGADGGFAGSGGFSGFSGVGGVTGGQAGQGGGGGFGQCVQWTREASGISQQCGECLCTANNVTPWMHCDASCWALLECEQNSGCAPNQSGCFDMVCALQLSQGASAELIRPLVHACGAACAELAGIGLAKIDTPPTCGPAQCPPPDGLPSSPMGGTACCTEAGACGVTLGNAPFLTGCVTPDPMGVNDTQCPGEDLSGGFPVHLPGCCRTDNRCGLRWSVPISSAAVGCVERVELGAVLLSSPIPPTPPWQARSCMFRGDPPIDLDAGASE